MFLYRSKHVHNSSIYKVVNIVMVQCLFFCPALVWSLSSVKVALSHLHWQREKVRRSDTPLHLKLGSTLMEVVGGAFHLQDDHLFNRTRMVKALLSQQKRGAVSNIQLGVEKDTQAPY